MGHGWLGAGRRRAPAPPLQGKADRPGTIRTAGAGLADDGNGDGDLPPRRYNLLDERSDH